MGVDPRIYLQPRTQVNFSPLRDSLQKLAQMRMQQARLEEQRRHAEAVEAQNRLATQMRDQQHMDQLGATLAHRQAEAARHQRDFEFKQDKETEARRQFGVEEKRKQGKADLDRQKAISGEVAKVGQALGRGITSPAELRALAPGLDAMGVEMRFAERKFDPSDIEDLGPDASEEEQIAFAKRVAEQAAKAAGPPETMLELVDRATGKTLQAVSLQNLAKSQQQTVGAPLRRVGEFAPMGERPFYAGAAEVAGDLRGTPEQRQRQALAIAQGMSGRQAAMRAAAAGGERADEKSVEYGFKRAKAVANEYKANEIIESYATAKSIESLLNLGQGVSDNVVIGYVAKLWNGGRISDADFRVSKGTMSWWDQAKTYFTEKSSGTMPPELKARFREVAKDMIRVNTERFEDLNADLKGLSSMQLSREARAGAEQYRKSAIEGKLKREMERAEESAKEEQALNSEGEALLKELGGG